MSPDADSIPPEPWQVEALLAFDAALAAGHEPAEAAGAGPPLRDAHECQRLLERVWPRVAPVPGDLPRRFGRFLLLRELGRGGFGVVFLARDSSMGREVALKLPRPEVLVSPEARRRFLREGEAAGRLDHPHIVPVYEVGEYGDVCYIASAYCEGGTLGEWLRGRTAPVPVREAAALVAALADAVGHAHARGIVHRDLKPGNVLLQRPAGAAGGGDPDLIVRVGDFGLAKILGDDAHDTRSGAALGSPAYMAPEQAAGRAREIGPTTDVFALGVIFYELLTGRPPFQGETPLETLQQVRDGEPPPPRALRPGLPRDLDTVCMKCLEKRPDRRYPGGPELADDLNRFLAGFPVRARPVAAWARAGRWARRRPAHAALSAALLLGLLLTVAGLAWSGARDRRAGAVLLRALDRARESERRAQDQTRLATERERLSRRHWAAHQTRLAQTFHDEGAVEVAAELLDGLRPGPGREDLRGFAWHYLDRLCRRLESSETLPNRPRCSVLSADGRTFAVGDEAGNVHLWDLPEGQLRTVSGKHALGVDEVLVSPDGRVVASLAGASSLTSEVKLRDVATGEEWSGLPREFGQVFGITFTPDGTALVTVEVAEPPAPPRVRFWSLLPEGRRVTARNPPWGDSPGAVLPSVLAPRSAVAGPASAGWPGLALSADGLVLGIDSGDGEVTLSDTRSGRAFAVCRIVDGEVRWVETAQGSRIDVDRGHRYARSMTGVSSERRLCPDLPVDFARFSPDGRTLAVHTVGDDIGRGTLRLFDTGSGRVKADYPVGDASGVNRWSFSPDGRSLAFAVALQARARVWHFEAPSDPPAPRGHSAEVWGLAYSPDGRTLASASDDGSVKLWDAATGRERATLEGHGSLVTSVAFSPDGALLATASYDHTVRLWEAATGRALAALGGHTDRVRAVAFSPDGRTLASAGNDTTVRLWDVATRRECVPPQNGHTGMVHAVAFTPDGQTLASASDDGTVRLWDWRAGRTRAVCRAGDVALALAIAPDGRSVASVHARGDVILWDMDGTPRVRTRGHVLQVLGVAFSPDGRTLATAGRDRTVHLWDPVTGYELLRLLGHADRVHAVAFSPDGTTLATGSHDGAIRLWRSGSPGGRP